MAFVWSEENIYRRTLFTAVRSIFDTIGSLVALLVSEIHLEFRRFQKKLKY